MSMITPKTKEKAIILGAFGFLSKEVDEYMKIEKLSLSQVLDSDEHEKVRKCIRLLQKIEIQIGNENDKAEKYLNKCIAKLNQKKAYNFIDGVIGLSMLMTYKEQFTQKRVLKGIPWDIVNDIYTIFEQDTKKEDKKVLIESQYLADDLYREILK